MESNILNSNKATDMSNEEVTVNVTTEGIATDDLVTIKGSSCIDCQLIDDHYIKNFLTEPKKGTVYGTLINDDDSKSLTRKRQSDMQKRADKATESVKTKLRSAFNMTTSGLFHCLTGSLIPLN